MTQEDIRILMTPMAIAGQEAIGSMGADNPIAVLSNKAKPLFNYFKQNFAQVTNPPIDPIREELVMSLVSLIGPRPNLLGLHSGGEHMRLEVTQPILTNKDLERIRNIEKTTKGAFRTKTLDICYAADQGAAGMERRYNQSVRQAEEAVREDFNILILSDRVSVSSTDSDTGPAGHLSRTSSSGACRPAYRVRTGGGNRCRARSTSLCHAGRLWRRGDQSVSCLRNSRFNQGRLVRKTRQQRNQQRYIKAVGKGMLKVMSKMGISTYQSYCGAQIFDAVGLKTDFVEKYFTGTASIVEGVGLKEVAEEAVRWHRDAYGDNPIYCQCAGCGRRLCLPSSRRRSHAGRRTPLPSCNMPRAPMMPRPLLNSPS